MLWKKCLETLRAELPPSIFPLWILPLAVKDENAENGKLELCAPNSHFCEHIEENYLELIQKTARKYHGKPIEVTISVDNHIQLRKVAKEKKTPQNEKRQAQLNKLFTFDNFVVGSANQMAHATALDVQKRIGDQMHNPLFLYGPTGLGKTHLMQAVGHEVFRRGKKVRYMTSEQFVQQFVSSARNKKLEEFAKRLRDTDLLMIDDIHFLGGKTKSESTFLSLFNDLVAQNKQIILTSDRHPSALKNLEERLSSRLSSGLSVELEPPALETRMDIVMKKASSSGVMLPKECAHFIAQQVRANVRELEGALNKVLATARFKDEPISIELIKGSLKEIVQIRSEVVSIANIQKEVCDYYEITTKDILSRKRSRNIARPRQLAMKLSRELTQHSFPEIAAAFSKKDHTTVMHACDTITKLCENDPTIAKDYQTIRTILQS